MLTRSWVLFDGVGEVAESKLWKNGLHDWTDDTCFRQACELVPRLAEQNAYREHALNALRKRQAGEFAQALPSGEVWRLWEEFKDDALFLDIETNGLGTWAHITVLGTYYKGRFRAFVYGRDLEQAWDYLQRAALIISFNGRQFDVPFIERHFAGALAQPHIDLRFVASSLGYKGGLKKIEPEFGIERDTSIKAVNGYEAVRLWSRFKRGDARALELLIDYNQADVENLPIIMQGCWDRKLELAL